MHIMSSVTTKSIIYGIIILRIDFSVEIKQTKKRKGKREKKKGDIKRYKAKFWITTKK